MALLIYTVIIFLSVLQSASTKLYNRKNDNALIFNLIKTFSAFALFVIIAVPSFSFHSPTLVYGLLYGIALSLSMYTGYKALTLGPLALTSMLVSFSLLIPMAWGIFVRQESFGILKIFGLVALIAALILVNADKFKNKQKNTQTQYGLWIFFIASTFLANGIASILQKEHQTAYPSLYRNEFMFFALLICLLIFLSVSAFKVSLKDFKKSKCKLLAVMAGVANSLSSFFTLWLAGLENATVLFPIISAGTILLSLLCGKFIFKEKLKPNHYAAIVIGIASIIVLKL